MSTTVPSIETREFAGINNVADPTKVAFPQLRSAWNMHLDDTKKLVTMGGSVRVLSGSGMHSLWASKDQLTCLFVEQGSLKRLDPSLASSTTILEGLHVGAPMRYAETPRGIYVTNSMMIGKIVDGTYSALTSTTDAFKSTMPAGHLIAYSSNRLWVARDGVIWFSDPLALDRTDLRKGFIQLRGRVTMLRPVDDGVYVSDGASTFFLAGNDPKESVSKQVADYGVIEGTDVTVDSSQVGGEAPLGRVALWSTQRGLCVGATGGAFRNVTFGTYELRKVLSGGGAFFRRGNASLYLALLERQADKTITAAPLAAAASASADIA